MSFDLDDRLADLRRPPHWSTDERESILNRVLVMDPTPHREDYRLTAEAPNRRRRAFALTAAAGLAAAACIAIPAVLPAGSPGSADQAAAVQALHHLAQVAAVSPTDQLGPDQYLHLVDVEQQLATPGQPATESRFEEWIQADGRTWMRRTESTSTDPARVEVWLLPPGPQAIDGMSSPQFLDQLPTEPAALEAYVRANTVGSTSSDERIFVAVADIVRRGVASADLRSAAIDVLAGLGHVRLGEATQDSLGNPVQAFQFVDADARPGDVRTLMFDTRTAQITEEREYLNDELWFTRTVPVFAVVDAVPADIRATAVPRN
ncbi:MAG: hypothetical protein QOH89_3116 [Pseudonocardiales bacterium]|jgi:hypothetical protein|nr:hypothetical protein [Pseudonocardiales bacterium]